MKFKTVKSIIVMMICVILSSSFISPSKGKPERVFQKDSIANADYIKRLISYNKIYPFIRYNQNFLEWKDYSSIESFFLKLQQTPTRKLKIIHIGDSHVQTDIFTGFIRNEMQKIFGEGGRGFVFPYAAASTHSAYDYKTSYTGDWDFARNTQQSPAYDLGLSGATVHTSDSTASFKFVFPKWALKEDFNVIKLYCKRSPQSYDLKIKASGVASPLYVDCNAFNDKLYIEIKLPKASDTLEFFVNETDPIQNFFECYGLLIETSDNNGLLYNSVGINGAGLKSVLREDLLLYQLSELKPDAVILDVGVNDIYKTPFNKISLEKDLSKIIDIIQRAAPEAAIIIANPQDVYYKYWDETNCKSFSELTREIAFQKGCVLYDYYSISGGQYSMLKWLSSGLAQTDKVHLKASGYYLRGELLMNAILNSYAYVLKYGSKKEFIAAVEFPDTVNLNVKVIAKNLPEIKDTEQVVNNTKTIQKTVQSQTLYYTVKSGDNLGAIAQKYGVTVAQIQAWNGIKGTNISIGKTLKILKNTYGTTTQTSTIKPKTTTTTNKNTIPTKTTPTKTNIKTSTQTITQNPSTHVVKSGDNLWSIAKKYNVTVDQIKKMNNLKSESLKPGTVLKLK